MPSLTTLATYSGAVVALLLIPGPAVVYIVATGASQGRAAAVASVAGIHLGTLVHVLASVVGLSAVIVASPALFHAITFAGAVYLIVMGVRSLVVSSSLVSLDAQPAVPLRRIFRDGVVVNILNPKTAVFFLAFVPQFVEGDASRPTMQLLVLGLVFVAWGLATDGTYALLSGAIGRRLESSPRLGRAKDVVAGCCYIGLGAVSLLAG